MVTLSIPRAIIRSTLAGSHGAGGTGLVAVSDRSPASLLVFATEIHDNAHAALSLFGPEVAIGRAALRCQPVDFALSDHHGFTVTVAERPPDVVQAIEVWSYQFEIGPSWIE